MERQETPRAYWGAKAIMERIGLKDSRRLPFWIKKYALPAFPRYDPTSPCRRRCYYSDEIMLQRWLHAYASAYREQLLAKEKLRYGG